MSNSTRHYIIEILLIVVTLGGVFVSTRMANFMAETNRAELRPYLYIKFPERIYFTYTNNIGELLYSVTNNGKVSATEIIRSYKVYKIKEDIATITRPTHINTDYVYALAPQETLEGQPDQIDGIKFSVEDPIDGSYYLIELYVSYKGTQTVQNTTYYSKVEIKIQPLSLNNGFWNYSLSLKHRDEGDDQDLKKFLTWRNSNFPEILTRAKFLNLIYNKNTTQEISINNGSQVMAKDLFSNAFYTFSSTFSQSIAALFALFGIFLIFRFEWENQKLCRTYDSAKHAILKAGGQPHLACLDKDVKFFLFKANFEIPNEYGSRDIRIQIHNLEEVRHSVYKSILWPSIIFGVLFVVSISSLVVPEFLNNANYIVLAYYTILILTLLLAGLTLFFRAHRLSRDANELTFNTPNPYEKHEDASKLRKSTFLNLTENIDLIERDILEFTKFPFIMNFAFSEVEEAIRRRKARLMKIDTFETKKYITSGETFLIQSTSNAPDNEKDEVENIVCAENRDRLKIIKYLTNKYSEGKSAIPGLLFKIHAEIKKLKSNNPN